MFAATLVPAFLFFFFFLTFLNHLMTVPRFIAPPFRCSHSVGTNWKLGDKRNVSAFRDYDHGGQEIAL